MARRVIDDLAAGRDPDQGSLTTIMVRLRGHIERVFPDLDAEEIVQSTIARLVTRSDQLADADIANPWGYLVGSTRNAAHDAIRARKRRREVQLDALHERATPDDAVAALIERDASHTAVVVALRSHVEAGDALTIRVITTWLDVADELGRAPSTREVASAAGVSHTTVAQALKRFRAALPERL